MLQKMLLGLCLCLSDVALAKSLALSFDDGLDPLTYPAAQHVNHTILQTLKQNKIHAIIYPSISKIGSTEGLNLISEWGKQGHRIGNHGNLHLNLNKNEVNLSDYLNDMQHAHQVFSALEGFVPRYRFPFLKEGNTLEKRQGVRTWLSTHHYQSGAVSIDASDWYYNQLFLKYQQENDQARLEKLKRAYIFHLLDRAKYYDHLALQTLGRSPKHVLLLHVRAINAAWLEDIIYSFQKDGWQFIDSDTAYQDTIYHIQPNLLPAGESIIWSIAQIYGVKNLRYPAEDAPYEYSNLIQHGLNIEK
ncbi:MULTISPECIES: polysaccharide deacetylase family protein [unclassified Acinetobacter]|uniref:polysaccharide deacetylase family protein n=1 Tax=unclassified Acinetobacter TaxID=196816 RepID=UPI002934A66A|nr:MULTISPECIES: polysaccharide deacetylase family protein [unclassified Acinetobacter]WOE31834.1 polysaccharide deacetylase family protein [Acinetobacter sp. SAAs470]WOE37301.1 polysaccharide deacetylase family protein [Acinetobacter sp. SAAs474]